MNGTLLSVLEKQNRLETATLLVFLIKRTNDLLNVGSKLNELQIATLASDLLDFCQQETLEDVLMIFKMARKGQLGGKIYRLDGMVIFQEWIPAYLDLKYQERERFFEQKKGDIAAAENNVDKWSQEANKNIRKVIVGLITEKKKPFTPPPEPYLQNSDNFKIVLASELKECSKKELKKLKRHYELRTSLKQYVSMVTDEIKCRNKVKK